MRQHDPPRFWALAVLALVGGLLHAACGAGDGQPPERLIPGLPRESEIDLVAVQPDDSPGGFYDWAEAFEVEDLPKLNVGSPTARWIAQAPVIADPDDLGCIGSDGSVGCERLGRGSSVTGVNFGGPQTRAWAWQFIHPETAAVRLTDKDGQMAWQRPHSRLVLIPVMIGVVDFECPCRLTAIDSEGRVLEATDVSR